MPVLVVLSTLRSEAAFAMKPPPPPKKRMAPPPPVSASSIGHHTPTGLVVPAPSQRQVPPPPRSTPRAAGSSTDPRTPEQVVGNLLDGRFHVEGILGEGGMGSVYAGRDTVDGRQVAIKVLRSDFLSDSEIVQRFLNEAQAAAQIGSPHICDVFGIGTAPNGAAYFVMEFLDGVSLAGLLERERVLSVRRILRLGHQIATGLAAAHAAGIVHRDLKPDNIMVVARPENPEFAKILDFGVAKIGSSHSKLTRVGSVFGTPQYMSPEQAAGTPVDLRADVYSLGILLYEMAAGRVPFDDENMMNVLTHQMFREPRAVRDASPQVIPAELDALVRKCLQKDPKHRFASMHELAAEMERTATVLPADQYET
ncbi:MAG: serine/threonine protein kinase, partial [Proteobacteria bacterium]